VKRALTIIAAAALAWCCTAFAQAADYAFKAASGGDFYRPTPYEEIYGSGYNYGGMNAADIYDPLALPGLVSPTPQTASAAGGAAETYGTRSDGAPISYGIYDSNAPFGISSGFESITTPSEPPPAHTPVSDLVRSDGSIGTLAIPSLSISTKVYEGTTSASMAKGLGHFAESSGWNGNVCLAGHNRSAAHAIGRIKDMKIGDTIRYTTVLGTRTYAVAFVGTISSTDWSYICATPDNRITLITCLSNQPSLRVCLVAVEVK